MKKPRLPVEIQALLPHCIVRRIHGYIPSLPPPKPKTANLQYHIERLQRSPKLTAMCLYGLEEYMLE